MVGPEEMREQICFREPASRNGLFILVVEDYEITRTKLSSDTLTGYKVVDSKDGEQAWDLFSMQHPPKWHYGLDVAPNGRTHSRLMYGLPSFSAEPCASVQ